MSNSNLFIETERLLIRPFKMEDIEPSYIMNLDAEVSRYTGDGGIVSKEEIELMEKLKTMFDPKNILNPGRIVF